MRGRAEAVAEAVPRGERSCPTQCRGAEAAARWSAEAAARRPRVTGRPRALSLARRRNECTYVRRARRAGPSHHRPSTIPRAGSIVGHPPHARHDVTTRARGTLITLPRPMLREGEGSNGAPRVVRGRARRTARTLTESAPPSRSRRRRDLSSLLSMFGSFWRGDAAHADAGRVAAAQAQRQRGAVRHRARDRARAPPRLRRVRARRSVPLPREQRGSVVAGTELFSHEKHHPGRRRARRWGGGEQK